MDKKIRVLIVDDSVFAREVVKEILSSDPQIEVIGEASDGEEACRTVGRLKPDLITMDIMMPVMNGLEAIERIMGSHPTPILVLTSRTDAQIAYQAVAKGALDIFRKPKLNEIDAGDLISRIKTLSKVKVIKHLIRNQEPSVTAPEPPKIIKTGPGKTVIGIASSTGGPKALAELLASLPADLPASILIAQHIGGGFSLGLATWLNQVSPLHVQVGYFGQPVEPGQVYIAPDKHHIELGPGMTIRNSKSAPEDIYTPSCNRLFSSIAMHAENSMGVILSGMGTDGSAGIKSIYDKGGFTIAQDEESSVIFGMPGSAIQTGCVSKVLPLSKISSEMIRQVTGA